MRLSSTAEAGLFCDKLEEFSSQREQNDASYGLGILKGYMGYFQELSLGQV
jgi:hypothetical protein